jgi:DNA-directed RNA polymerase specialized sigma24 family protein
MDEKTDELRDIFMDVTDSDTVTESQAATKGSLTDDEQTRERLADLVAELRDRYAFETELSDGQYCELALSFYDGASDAELARELDVDRRTVFRARLDLHCFRDRDLDAPFDVEEFRTRVTGGEDVSTAELADEFDVSESTVRRYRRVAEARDESRRANDRYRDEFDSILGDADLAGPLTQEAREDGLDDATEGMETDVSF